jgi:hypothetical protein
MAYTPKLTEYERLLNRQFPTPNGYYCRLPHTFYAPIVPGLERVHTLRNIWGEYGGSFTGIEGMLGETWMDEYERERT